MKVTVTIGTKERYSRDAVAEFFRTLLSAKAVRITVGSQNYWVGAFWSLAEGGVDFEIDHIGPAPTEG